MSGEDMRRHMYLVTDTAGREFCLRPDLTIPVARHYLASATAQQRASFCYLGPVFRDSGVTSGEFLQAGIESFGRADTAAADAEVLALGIEATAHYGLAAPRIVIGDVALFSALITALDLAPAWKRRLLKDFNRKTTLAQDLERLTLAGRQNRSEYQGVLAALANANPKAAQALVTDLLSIAGKSAVGGGSIGENAHRFVGQGELAAPRALPAETRGLIGRGLAAAGTHATAPRDAPGSRHWLRISRGSNERARPRSSGQRSLAGERRGVFRPRRAGARQAARGARLSWRHQTRRRRRGGVSFGLGNYRAACCGSGAFRHHWRRSGAGDDSGGRPQGGAAGGARLRLRQCGGGGAR